MSIKIKIARSPKEIDDALWLRHEVFVVEDGKFGGKPFHGHRLVDRFDAFPSVFHVIAYDGPDPIATMRLVKDSAGGLPADELFDFDRYRRRTLLETSAPVFGSAGMLAIREAWRRRRDVIRAMFRMAATVCKREGATHILVAVNHETAGMYERLGFTPLSEKIWNDEIENHIVPLAGSTDQFVAWAFQGLPDTPLSAFQDSFERMVFRAGETIFQEGDVGEHAFVVDSGEVQIGRKRESGEELTLAIFGRGDMFGELALLDDQPRSASAQASADCELMTLDRATFQEQLHSHPERSTSLFRMFAGRMRAMDELAMVLAFAGPAQRLEFAMEIARQQAVPDRNDAARVLFHGGPADLARMAAVTEQEARRFVEGLASAGVVSLTPRFIGFKSRKTPP
ncbi:MAG: cyclic nucleotide-binding domain-containing protein [Betaproteobacteria bacterium]|nr:cyclic nucleotide-binding domain-containing protein [Betaproteobacteria bacterium]